MTGPAGAATGTVQDSMFRALAVLRVVLLVNALGLGWYRRAGLDHPGAALAFFVVLAAWTVVATWAYAAPRRRGATLLLLDLAVALLGIGLTPWIKGLDFGATLPGFWVMVVVLAWAVLWGWPGGLVAAAAISVSDIAARASIDQSDYGNVFLLLVGGALVGFLCDLLGRATRERDAAERAAAVAEERARLARVVHDGVLQVLALVQRRGAEIGGETAELARLAGEQEVALRALVQRREPAPAYDVAAGDEVDLAELVGALQARPAPRVQVAVPGGRVPMTRERAEELVAVAGACLHNVVDHVGAEATAWVLLEDLEDEVVLTVRDDGPGIADGRLDAAAADGRLGVSESIRGRTGYLGGTATLHSSPAEGTEWEIRVPRGDASAAWLLGGGRR
ncbi:histidine kinase [Marmoricola endophyticus]|uniref:Histidine kinase n=1 Tax=Marmoricola endophyticus TaxID=2040280 RepID=A0A917BAS5_9ACTN|nr:DUF5931 domain-containing protein [Marmoricola endophyticus]GGF31608.1 histidine kinase [Marmoricola endophyticus]